MLKALIVFLATIFLSPPLAAHAEESAVKLTDLKVISLHGGINKLRAFAPDGRDGVITKAWRETGDDRSFFIYSVLMKGQDEYRWPIASIWNKYKNNEQFTIIEYPFDGEHSHKRVRFAKGKVNGERATLLITAQLISERRNFGEKTFDDPVHAIINIYRLITPDPNDDLDGLVHSEYYFKHIEERNPPLPYCDSDVALAIELGLPAPTGQDVIQHPDGCPDEGTVTITGKKRAPVH